MPDKEKATKAPPEPPTTTPAKALQQHPAVPSNPTKPAALRAGAVSAENQRTSPM
jgi:hypothetical protein